MNSLELLGKSLVLRAYNSVANRFDFYESRVDLFSGKNDIVLFYRDLSKDNLDVIKYLMKSIIKKSIINFLIMIRDSNSLIIIESKNDKEIVINKYLKDRDLDKLVQEWIDKYEVIYPS